MICQYGHKTSSAWATLKRRNTYCKICEDLAKNIVISKHKTPEELKDLAAANNWTWIRSVNGKNDGHIAYKDTRYIPNSSCKECKAHNK